MKLRIKGNTLRMRLTQTEVEALMQGRVEDRTHFPGGAILTYAITKADTFSVGFHHQTVEVRLPAAEVAGWATTDKVEMKYNTLLETGDSLQVSIEKDFKCLTERPHEDESDMFPNPLEKHSKC